VKISLATSLHLSHAGVSPSSLPGDPLQMQSFVPIGLLSLKATADHAGLHSEIRINELNGLVNRGVISDNGHFYENLTDAILAPDDGLVGLMTDADSLHHTLIIADTIKRRSPETMVCLGGPAASPIGRSILERFPFIDFVVRGEGEITFSELIRSLDHERQFGGVRGLIWRDGDQAVENPERELVPDLDALPVPFFPGYEMEQDAALYLDVGRGCPFNCSFCATAPFWKRRYRMKSIGRITQEMTLVRNLYGRRHVNFSHDIFTCDRKWTHEFCDELIAADLGMTWTCSTRTDLIDRPLLDKMAAAGCTEMYYGIESGSQAGQAEIRKHLDLDESRKIVRSTAEAGIHPITGFIVGYPTETLETFGRTLEGFFEFLQIGGFRAHLFTLCPYHESALFEASPQVALKRAECFDLPLESAESLRTDELRQRYPIIFASSHRYVCPQVPDDLIAASEELSPKLVMLKSIWPLWLAYYESPLVWYRRWVGWIEDYNAKTRPATRWPHQCDPGDLLMFATEELDRLGAADSDFAELVRYEQLKLRAYSLKSAPATRSQSSGIQSKNTRVVKRSDYLSAPFSRDIHALLAGERSAGMPSQRWIVCFKNTRGDLSSIELSPMAMLLLGIVDEPKTVDELAGAFSAVTGSSSDKDRSLTNCTNLVHELIRHDLVEEVV